MKRLKELHFTIHGDFITDFFRDFMLEGNEGKAYISIGESFPDMEAGQIKQILEGNAQLEGINDLEFIIKENKAYKKKLKQHRAYVIKAAARKAREEEELRNPQSWAEETASRFNSGRSEMRRLELKLPVVGNSLDKMIKEMTAEVPEYKEEKPVPDELDSEHRTWFCDPEGNWYKVNWQDHDNWLKHYHGIFGLENQYEALQAGWIRVSSGLGDGHIFVSTKDERNITKEQKRYLEDLAYEFRFFHIGFGLEMDLDYKGFKRTINESVKK